MVSILIADDSASWFGAFGSWAGAILSVFGALLSIFQKTIFDFFRHPEFELRGGKDSYFCQHHFSEDASPLV